MKTTTFATVLAFVGLVSPLLAQGAAEQEPNDTLSSASGHPLGDQSYGDLAGGDLDWFKLVMPQGGDLRAWTAPGIGPQCGDTRLALFDPTGQLLVEVDDGNLATHVAKLEKAGYVAVHKRFVGRKPRTTYTMTARGRAAFDAYLRALEALLPPRAT